MAALQFTFFLLLLFISMATQIPPSSSETEAAKQSLVKFMENLSGGSTFPTRRFGWNMTSDPCNWLGVECDDSQSVVSISLSWFRFAGTLNAAESLCTVVKSITVLSLPNNTISGGIPDSLGSCTGLRILNLGNNRLTGSMPDSILRLPNLTGLVISDNEISGEVPDGRPSLRHFLAENNRLSGRIPEFDFRAMDWFNVSNNEFGGPIPVGAGSSGFGADCFAGNPGLCGQPVSSSCPPPASSSAPSASLGLTGLGLGMVMVMVSCSLGISLVSPPVFSF
ncbi:unnamed protein product [Linum trigynum]|uniref:Leucine-rich repeat-containing N-terminal plant-type domain-containing protein n=1 Tax=Linum trigynum TaxID=586398 RepID=A0AAV2GUV1_9ROSI